MLAACLAALALALPGRAAAETDVYIGLTSQLNPELKDPLAVAPFVGERGSVDAVKAKAVEEVLRDDLLFSRYFSLSEQGPPPEGEASPGYLQAWSKSGARHLLFAKVTDLGARIALAAKLFDVGTGETLLERYYREEPRRAAHALADDVIEKLTGKHGIARSRIAFAANGTGHKELYVVDYDGEGMRRLTEFNSITLLPRWTRDAKSLLYTTWKDGNPDLYSMDLESRALKPVSTRQGLNVAGGFSPDGKQLVLTLSMGQSPNLWILKDGEARRVTDHPGIDTSPTFSPDGRQIAFVSDRSGNPQVYVLEVQSGLQRRITRMNWCDNPAWSPSGEWIVFAAREAPFKPFDIWLSDLTGNVMRNLTRGRGTNEDPSWSPDGRFIAFTTTRRGKRELFVMDADGSAPHPVAEEAPGQAFTPAWSP